MITRKRITFGKLIVIFLICSFVLILFENEDNKYRVSDENTKNVNQSFRSVHNRIVEDYYDKRKSWKTSNLGSILFKNVKPAVYEREDKKNKTFVVLIWKYWDWLKNRHIHSFTQARNNPLEQCSVKNCKFTGNVARLESADAVVVHIQHGEFPKVAERNPRQRWIFLTDEAAVNTFSLAKVKPSFSDLANVFNWSMTFRTDSDVPVPYGRTIPVVPKVTIDDPSLTGFADIVPNWYRKKRNVLATILMSNCGVTQRMAFLKDLRRFLTVDIHGACSDSVKNSCPGHFKSDCDVMSEYLFYLVSENSMCRQYLTEKSFYHAYLKGAIPVILGPPIEDCEKLLPPNSFLHVANYETTLDLAKDIINISRNDSRLMSYHLWRNDFRVVNEHGYFGTRSHHYCRVCEALNYNDDDYKVYQEEDLRLYLDPLITCQ